MHLFGHHNREYKLVARSKFFDKKWYLKTYPDVANAKIDPIKHYIQFGWKENRNPSSGFSTQYYLTTYMHSANMCPLVHYEQYGKRLNIRVVAPEQRNALICTKCQIDANNVLAPSFSVIIPTYNRADLIVNTVHSVLAQTYPNFEIIIVDDGSTDGTKQKIYTHFLTEIKNKKIRYFYKNNGGVCKARNYGLGRAKNNWIVYVDSDNLLFPSFLSIFAQNIISTKGKYKTLYCNSETFSGNILGRIFDYQQLIMSNYIDLGMFVHHVEVYKQLGGFDENMTRLVDWELILRYTKQYKPLYINSVLCLYNDTNDHQRISNNEALKQNLDYLRKKHRI